MASKLDGPLTSAGPLIDGGETELRLYDPQQLAAYSQWPELLVMVNESFGLHHTEFWPRETTQDRFKNPKEFLDTLEPDFFTYILTSKDATHDGTPRILATASARTAVAHTAPDHGNDLGWGADTRHVPGETEAWELKILAVDAALRKKGVGSMLMDVVEAEVKKRAGLTKLAKLRSSGGEEEAFSRPMEVIYSLSTLAEVNEQFYLRRGYKSTKLIPIEVGTMGLIKACHVVHMERMIAV